MKLLDVLVPVLLLAAAGFLVTRQVHRDPPRYLRQPPGEQDAGLDLLREAMSRPLRRYPVHLYGPEGTPLETGCCGRDVFALPEDHRTTPHRDKVTCAGGEQ